MLFLNFFRYIFLTIFWIYKSLSLIFMVVEGFNSLKFGAMSHGFIVGLISFIGIKAMYGYYKDHFVDITDRVNETKESNEGKTSVMGDMFSGANLLLGFIALPAVSAVIAYFSMDTMIPFIKGTYDFLVNDFNTSVLKLE